MPSTNSPPALNGAVDVLLICALKDEYDQVREVTDGLLSPGWVESHGPRGWIVADGRFATASGAQLSIRTTWAEHMGREQAQAVASFLIQAQPARCIAMSGICAGRRNKVALGDVIFAERLWSYDAGKMREENGEQHFEGDPLQYRPRPGWVQRMQHLRISPDTPWLALRPLLPLEHQEDWILLRLLAGEDPRSSVDRKDACPDWDKALLRLWQRKWLENPLTLTDLGRARAEELNLLYFGKLPAPATFQTHIAPVATGASVTEDTGIFSRLANSMRKVLGVEMEASALGALGELHNVPVVVAKGVSDYGDPFKDDRYRLFAARASAECLIVLLRRAADLISIGDSIPAIDRMEPATPTPPAGPHTTELPHQRPQQPTLSLASSGLVLLGDYRASRELSSTTSEAVPEDSRKREPAEAKSLSQRPKVAISTALREHILNIVEGGEWAPDTLASIYYDCAPEEYRDRFDRVRETDGTALVRAMLQTLATVLPQSDGVHPLLRFALHLAKHAEPARKVGLTDWVIDVAGHLGVAPFRLAELQRAIENAPLGVQYALHLAVVMRELAAEPERYTVSAFRILVPRGRVHWIDGDAKPIDSVDGRGYSINDIPGLLNNLVDELTGELELSGNELTIELVVPLKLVNQAADRWECAMGMDLALPFGVEYEVIVRPWERAYGKDRARLRARWVAKWNRVHDLDAGVTWVCTREDAQAGIAARLHNDGPVCVALRFVPHPDHGSGVSQLLRDLVAAGIPVAAWPREPSCNEGRLAECIGKLVEGPRQWHRTVRFLRREAHHDGDPGHPGHHLTVLWDDPNKRLPDMRPEARLSRPKK